MEYYYKKIAETEKIENAWIGWLEYRNKLTEYILKTLPFCKNKSIAIYGAGECNDINVRMLLNKGYKITLFDCDTARVESAAKEKGYFDEIEIKEIDFFHIKDEEYERLEELFYCKAAKEDVASYLMEILNREGEEELYIPSEKYGLNVCIGIHSQILVKIICLMKLHGFEDFSGVIHKVISEMNGYMTERLNDELFKKGHGDVILGYEYGVFEKGKADEIISLFYAGRAKEVINKGISRVSGAYEAELDLQRRFSSGNIFIADYNYEIWNFIDKKEYLMVIYHVI